MRSQTLLCGLFLVSYIGASRAAEVDVCFALWDAEDESEIAVRGEIVEVGKDYLVIASGGRSDACELEVFPDNKVVPGECRVGGTALARGTIFSLDYNDLDKAAVSCK